MINQVYILNTCKTSIPSLTLDGSEVSKVFSLDSFPVKGWILSEKHTSNMKEAYMKKFITALSITMMTSSVAMAQTPGYTAGEFVNAIEYGFVPNNSAFDNSLILNQWVDNIGTERTIYFPSGNYHFLTKPDVIDKQIKIVGDGLSTTFKREFQPTSWADALFYATATIHLDNFNIIADIHDGGSAIRIEGGQADRSILSNLYITGAVDEVGVHPSGDTSKVDTHEWAIPLIVRRATYNENGDAPGIRDTHINNVAVFNASLHLAWFVNAQGLTAIDFNAYQGGGTENHITVQGLSTTERSSGIHILTRSIPVMYTYWADAVTVRGTADTIFYSTDSTNVVNK